MFQSLVIPLLVGGYLGLLLAYILVHVSIRIIQHLEFPRFYARYRQGS